MFDAEGMVYIPLNKFYEFVGKYHDMQTAQIEYGIPFIQNDNLALNFAASTENRPSEWIKGCLPVKEFKRYKEDGKITISEEHGVLFLEQGKDNG